MIFLLGGLLLTLVALGGYSHSRRTQAPGAALHSRSEDTKLLYLLLWLSSLSVMAYIAFVFGRR
ncbi:MAG: hypothetical protein ACK2TT_13140 [Anaerolineales bacterium]|jgi:hypothetical protein